MLDSYFTQIKFDYSKAENLTEKEVVSSEVFPAGGYNWKVSCLPRGIDKGDYVSIHLKVLNKCKNVSVIFEAFLMDIDGKPSTLHTKRLVKAYSIEGSDWGWSRFLKRSDVEPLYIVDGRVTILCGVIVVHDDCPLLIPPFDIGDHLRRLLTTGDGSDVSLIVGSKTFAAHRAVLAARSPVFKAELFGSMSEATMPCITLQDIDPTTFEVLLGFMYTDELPEDDDLIGDGDYSTVEMYQRLIAAADRYAMDRLKVMCACYLWEEMSADNVADVLACAETYSCPKLKEKCFGFLLDDRNFKKAVLTDGFLKLIHSFPSLVAELREKAASQ